MLLTITTTAAPATDLGYLLHKNPARVQAFALSFGQAHVFYPEATRRALHRRAAARRRPGRAGAARTAAESLDQYVNDRPYVASSFLSVAIAQVFGSALAGRSKERPELAETPLPLTARLAVAAVPRRRGASCAGCSSRSATR